MRIRTTLIAASLALAPALALAQTAAPAPDATNPPAATAPLPGAQDRHRERGEWRERRADAKQRYEKLSAADKAKFDDLTKQIRQLHQQQRDLLGLSKS
jgi:Spy/CpxP family protein refolding chaperone